MNRLVNFVLRPLCWLRWHPMRSRVVISKSGNTRTHCDVCGRFIKGGA